MFWAFQSELFYGRVLPNRFTRIVRISLYHSCLIAVLLAGQLRTQAKLFTECRGQRVSESTGTNSTRNLTSCRARPFLRTAKDTWVTFNHISFRLSPLHQCDHHLTTRKLIEELFFFYLRYIFVQKTYIHFWHFYHKHATKELSRASMQD